MDFIDYVVDESTPLELIPFIRCYAPHKNPPCKQELMETQYQMWETTGHCTLKGLALDAGYDSDDYITQLRKASEAMGRAMYEPSQEIDNITE